MWSVKTIWPICMCLLQRIHSNLYPFPLTSNCLCSSGRQLSRSVYIAYSRYRDIWSICMCSYAHCLSSHQEINYLVAFGMQHSVFGIVIENFGKSATHRRRVPLLYIYSHFAVEISIKYFGFMLSPSLFKYIVFYGTIFGRFYAFFKSLKCFSFPLWTRALPCTQKYS